MTSSELEAVAIEAIRVGDHVVVEPDDGPPRLACVLALAAVRLGGARTAGWRMVVDDGGTVWWPRRARVLRRRAAWEPAEAWLG